MNISVNTMTRNYRRERALRSLQKEALKPRADAKGCPGGAEEQPGMPWGTARVSRVKPSSRGGRFRQREEDSRGFV